MKPVRAYGMTLLLLILLDALWLGWVMKDYYRLHLGHLFGDLVAWWAVVLFYLLYAAAIVYFAVIPAHTKLGALGRGCLLGMTAYMTYDLTNQATLRDWPMMLTVLDILWGGVITALAAMAGKTVLRSSSIKSASHRHS